LPILAELLPQIETPVEIMGGLWDWAVPPSNHRFLHERLPKSKLDLIDAGHFTWEDAAEDYAELVTNWWAGGYAQAGSRQRHEGDHSCARGDPSVFVKQPLSEPRRGDAGIEGPVSEALVGRKQRRARMTPAAVVARTRNHNSR
jgi:hypothetical protein